MLPAVDSTGKMTARQMLWYCGALVLVALMPVFMDRAGWIYFFGALLVGSVFFFTTIKFFQTVCSAQVSDLTTGSAQVSDLADKTDRRSPNQCVNPEETCGQQNRRGPETCAEHGGPETCAEHGGQETYAELQLVVEARRVLRASLIYLPAILVLLLLSHALGI